MSVTVNGSLCGDPNSQYANEPCASVTICAPGTSNCQTINNLLLDTGSYGLRIFASLINLPLPAVSSASGTVADCVQFGDGASEWGSVHYADVELANEVAHRVPIELIDSGYSTPPPACSSSQSTPDISPQEAGFNGILGVGLFMQDCGASCANNANNSQYYACNGNSCSPTTVSLANQVQNPVSLLPYDNNGIILQLPPIDPGGAPSVNGSLILGIGTQPNNTPPSGIGTFAADQNGMFYTQFNDYSSTPIAGIVDSGSSVLFLPPPSSNQLPDCGNTGIPNASTLAGMFCPSSVRNFTATTIGASSSGSKSIPFQIANAYDLFNSGNAVFDDIGSSSGGSSGAIFDWGLPFFFGKSIYVGIEGMHSKLGTGPYWAY